ncbi:MAG: ribosome recycling factor [Alphaproteobacteria bacterium]|nr:ribosome recycling factor [Alphaproteobacteria bacterium]MDD9919712.1 ribosome recycling factor [Alphaproteobacteria bacterium]
MSDLEQRMTGALNALQKEFQGLRTGRASVDLLNPVTVDAYGSSMPLNQVGTVSAPEARTLTVQVWDKGMVASVEKAIRDAGLGLNPVADGQSVRVPMPELNEERRQELIKVAKKYAEEARIAIRNVRRDGMDVIKKQQKDGDLSEDDAKREENDVQKLTDNFVKQVDTLLSSKETDIMQV